MNFGSSFLLRPLSTFALSVMALCSSVALCYAAELKVTNAWVKLAPPSSSVNAAYMQLTNELQETLVITQISADCCAMTMLHQTRQDKNKMVMDHLEQLTILPKSTIELKPGGLHIMLMNSRKPLLVDEPIGFTFRFSDGSQQKVQLFVKRDTH
jgi:periplasmic copper chaperone A